MVVVVSSSSLADVCRPGGEGGLGTCMSPWYIVLVCMWGRLLPDRPSPPFRLTLFSPYAMAPIVVQLASHHPVSFLFLLALFFPLHCPLPFP